MISGGLLTIIGMLGTRRPPRSARIMLIASVLYLPVVLALLVLDKL